MAEDDASESALPSIPEIYVIPDDVINSWIPLSANTVIQGPLTKQDLDNLYFSISNIAQSTTLLAASLADLSFGKNEDANAKFRESARFNIIANNNLRLFFQRLVESTVRAQEGKNEST